MQLVTKSLTFAIYRKKTYQEKYAYYKAPESEIKKPSGRKWVKRMTWNRRSQIQGFTELTESQFVKEINKHIETIKEAFF